MFDLPEVKFGSPNGVGDGTELSEIFKPVQSYLLCNNPESNVFEESSSITECLEALGSVAGTDLESGYNPRPMLILTVRIRFQRIH